MVTEIDHTTIINCVEEAGESLPDEPQNDEIPEITEIDELQILELCCSNLSARNSRREGQS